MKRKILMYVAILSMASTVASATIDEPLSSVNVKSSSVINAYIDANVHCKAALLNQVMKDEAVLNINRQGKIIQHTKMDLVNFYKREGDLTLNCKSDFEILSSNDSVVMARVDFKFPLFTQQNYIVIERDSNGLWKISQINRFNG